MWQGKLPLVGEGEQYRFRQRRRTTWQGKLDAVFRKMNPVERKEGEGGEGAGRKGRVWRREGRRQG